MPIYQYQAVKDGCEKCRGGFEVLQPMSAEPLQICPECGAEVRKCASLFHGGVGLLSNGRLRDQGFTKLKNRGDGTYENLT